MKKVIYALILSLVVVSGFVFANREIKAETSEKSTPKPASAESRAELEKKWEADARMFKEWKASPDGRKIRASAAKLRSHTRDSTTMEAVVTSLSLPPGSRVGYGMMVRIDGDEYILSFGVKKANEFQQLRSLNVNDKILLKSHGVSYAPKYSFPIVSGDYVERNSELIYKAPPRKGGC